MNELVIWLGCGLVSLLGLTIYAVIVRRPIQIRDIVVVPLVCFVLGPIAPITGAIAGLVTWYDRPSRVVWPRNINKS